MHPTSKVVERNSEALAAHQSLLIYGPPEHDDLGYLKPAKVVTVDFRVKNSLSALGDVLQFGLEVDSGEVEGDETKQYDAALIFVPKAKAELDLVLAYVTSELAEGADIYLVGEKKAGIASAAKKLQSYSDDASKIDSAAHCQFWHASLSENGADAQAQKTARFKLDDWMTSYDVTLNDISLKVATIPGVFSHGELDDATRLLMENMFYKLRGRVLDFGCGTGVLGCYTKLLNPEISLEMIDLNWLALACSARTAELNQIEAKVYASDGWSEVKGRVNAVVTNPPFHQGIATEYNTTESFIRQSAGKMSKHAPLLLVANNFLRYAPIIESTLGRCDVMAETTKFRAYKAYR